MATTHPHHPPTPVIAADPSRLFTPRPLIAELIRTQYCAPGSILLVESVEAHIPVSRRYRTVRLLLGDGELCIQALLRPEMHRFVDGGQVFVGCFVQLSGFELKTIQVASDGGSGDAEDMVLLVVRDMATVGWNITYMQMAGTVGQEPQGMQVLPTASKSQVMSRKGKEVAGVAQEPDVPFRQRTPHAVTNREEDINTDDPLGAIGVVADWRSEHVQGKEMPQQHTTASHVTHSTSDSLPWTAGDLSKPLKLTPLKSIPNLPYKQNWVVNVLAVVASLSEVEPANLPPYKQRTARLADPSTSKQVHLTVFLEADGFAPEVGSVVLLLGVKNHRFDGGSLKKYGNEKHKDRSKWWFENPKDIDWCDVAGLRRWWDERLL